MFDESVLAQQKVYVSGGRIGTQVCCAPADLIKRSPRHNGTHHFLKIWHNIWIHQYSLYIKSYLLHKSYLKRKRMAKLHKTFESFLAAGEHKGEIAETLFAKLFFCRKLYVVQANAMPPKTGAGASPRQGAGTMKLRRTSGMRNMLLKTIGRQCGEGHQGLGVTSWP